MQAPRTRLCWLAVQKYPSMQRPHFGAEADADRSSGYMHDGDTDHLLRCDLRWPA